MRPGEVDRGSLIGWGLGAATAIKAHQNGATPMEVLNTGLGWRLWYAYNSFGGILMAVWFFILTGASNKPVAVTFFLLQVTVMILVAGCTYVRLVVQSNFQVRSAFRFFWPVAKHIPNVAPVWLYMLNVAVVFCYLVVRQMVLGIPT